MKKIGRPVGAPNTRSGVIRDTKMNHFRCSAGLKQVCDMLIEAGHYKSYSDIFHEAVFILAGKKTLDREKFPNYDATLKQIL